jgi:nucleoid DNA-binding protein
MQKKPLVGRREFVRKLMMDVGLTFDQACRAYTCFISVIEDGVTSGEKIGFGRVGSLTPVKKPARDVVMGFERLPGGKVARTKRIFHVDERIAFKFNLYEEFVRKHQLKW